MPQYNYVQIGFTPETIDELDSMADDENVEWDSRSEIVREAVGEFL